MSNNLFSKERLVGDHTVQEPTVLAVALTATVLMILLVACVVCIAALPALGGVWWAFAAVGIILACLILSRSRQHRPSSTPSVGRQLWLHRLLALARRLFVGVLTAWLGLIVWLAVCPGGPKPPPKSDPASIRVVTWNIHCGQTGGPPWKQFDWPGRREALRAAVDQAQPDILCVQEATPEQVAFLEKALPGHRRVGVGRDDGKAAGEHCAIYFNQERFEEIGGDTFWLEKPIDQPRPGSGLDVKRICTWVRLRDRLSGRTVRVYNAHLYLTEAPSLTAARLILDHIAAGDPTDAVVVMADFNATPGTPSRRLFRKSGLEDSAKRAGQPVGQRTLQLYGIGLRCIDGILVDGHWRVDDHRVLRIKPNNIFPSDHFGLLADLAWPE